MVGDRRRAAGACGFDHDSTTSPWSGLRPESVRARGVAAVPEGHQVLGDLTVEDNLKGRRQPPEARGTGARDRGRARHVPRIARAPERALGLSFGRPAADGRARAGDRRPGRAICSPTNCPSASLRSSSRGSCPCCRSSPRRASACLLIEQFTHIALKIADCAYVMERGRISFSGRGERTRRNPGILHSAYLWLKWARRRARGARR